MEVMVWMYDIVVNGKRVEEKEGGYTLNAEGGIINDQDQSSTQFSTYSNLGHRVREGERKGSGLQSLAERGETKLERKRKKTREWMIEEENGERVKRREERRRNKSTKKE